DRCVEGEECGLVDVGRDRPVGPVATVEIAEELPGGALPVERILLARRPAVDDHDVDLLAIRRQQTATQGSGRDTDRVDPLDLRTRMPAGVTETRAPGVEELAREQRAAAARPRDLAPARITRERAPPDLGVDVAAGRIDRLKDLLHRRREYELRRHRRALIVDRSPPPVRREVEVSSPAEQDGLQPECGPEWPGRLDQPPAAG